ncbi:2-keto-4-pentenoate hydratase [Lentibacillus persicus]|uniref:2-keto-4-pentenoate hydratase n=1 Tax=Lentibacillus persicus TaxID=640948 RepID=A0A1I2A3T5_9BACI|nr:2-keto-4-pentenoate hydratase [Lentibacillus persicus]SFE38476.1 2-keto-4-pentenoate hydratase [Lentibacillus persicus]
MQTDSRPDAKQLAAHLAKAWEEHVGVQPVTELDPGLSIDEAYHVQLETIDNRTRDGEYITGKKIGLTSKAMQEMLGVDEPDYGHLLNKMEIGSDGTVSANQVLQPKVEGEIAFVLKEDLKGPDVTALDVLKATDVIVPAIEIVDSRIKDWKITLPDTIADNASSGLYVLGDEPRKIEDVDIKQIGMALFKNGKLENTGVGAAALGDPAKCVAWLANKLADYDIHLKAGEVILSGALSAAVEAEPGDEFRVKFSDLGELTVKFESV